MHGCKRAWIQSQDWLQTWAWNKLNHTMVVVHIWNPLPNDDIKDRASFHDHGEFKGPNRPISGCIDIGSCDFLTCCFSEARGCCLPTNAWWIRSLAMVQRWETALAVRTRLVRRLLRVWLGSTAMIGAAADLTGKTMMISQNASKAARASLKPSAQTSKQGLMISTSAIARWQHSIVQHVVTHACSAFANRLEKKARPMNGNTGIQTDACRRKGCRRLPRLHLITT